MAIKPRIALNMSREETAIQHRKIELLEKGLEMMHNDLVIISQKLDFLNKQIDALLICECGGDLDSIQNSNAGNKKHKREDVFYSG